MYFDKLTKLSPAYWTKKPSRLKFQSLSVILKSFQKITLRREYQAFSLFLHLS
jgi:hypothetical protein